MILIIESTYVYFQWTKVADVIDISKEVASVTTLNQNKHYNKVIMFLGKMLSKFSKLLIIPIIGILIVNTIFSLFFGFLAWLIF